MKTDFYQLAKCSFTSSKRKRLLKIVYYNDKIHIYIFVVRRMVYISKYDCFVKEVVCLWAMK